MAFRRAQPCFSSPRRAVHIFKYYAGREGLGYGNGVLLFDTGSGRTHKLPYSSSPGGVLPRQWAAWAVRVIAQNGGVAYLPCCSVHTQVLASAKESTKDVRPTGGSKGQSDEHGSVLMQFVEKKDEPKALTVGAKGNTALLTPGISITPVISPC